MTNKDILLELLALLGDNCNCPGCKARREEAKAEKPEPTETPEEGPEPEKVTISSLSEFFDFMHGKTETPKAGIVTTAAVHLENDPGTDLLEVGYSSRFRTVLVRADESDEDITILTQSEARKLALGLLKAAEALDE